jgi:colanic acid/amylovoran biosynthesis glycosyltransferase
MKIAYLRTRYLPITENFINDEIENIPAEKIVISITKENFFSVNPISLPQYNQLLCSDYPMIKKKNITLYQDFIMKVKKIIIEEKIDILHAQFGTDGLFFLPLKSMTNLPYVVSFRGYDVSKIIKKHPNIYKKLISDISGADLLLVRSDFMKRQLLSFGFQEKKIRIHHSGIDIWMLLDNL